MMMMMMMMMTMMMMRYRNKIFTIDKKSFNIFINKKLMNDYKNIFDNITLM